MGDKRWLLVNQHKYQAAKDRSSVVNSCIGTLAEKEGDGSGIQSRLGQLINDTTQKHCFALPGIPFDPEQPTMVPIAPLFEIGMFENPVVHVS